VFAPAVLAVASLLLAQPAAGPFELKDGDRIVWIGSTLVEREQRYGYWETALYNALPNVNFTVRNLGWSGDTVWGESRGRFDFDKPDVCFRQLVDQTLALKPTVIFISYGTNESFEGEAGLARFEQGLNKLLDALRPANARVVLFSPTAFGPGPGLPDPGSRNKNLAAYVEAIRKVATTRGHTFADLYGASVGVAGLVTENGMHLTGEGYRDLVPGFLGSLGQKPTTTDWQTLDPLRKAVVEKNELFFHRWRPQNETYLFGFRKHEQGKNAKEVAEFDPLVAKAEDEIARIRKTLQK
jgi:lysophospholipase L1-like esterase